VSCALVMLMVQGVHASEAPDEVGAPESSAVEAACAKLEAETKQHLSTLRPPVESDPQDLAAFFHPMRKCIAAGRGSWFMLPVLSSRRTAISGRVVPTYVGPDGTRTSAAQELNVSYSPTPDMGNTSSFTIMPMMDFDRNGVHELIVREAEQGYDTNEWRFSVFSYSASSVVPYPPLAGIRISAIGDYDRDGVIDVVSNEAVWWTEYCISEHIERIGAPPVLYHARADGTFSASDEVAARWLREQCPAPPDTLLETTEDEYEWPTAALQNVACARTWGASAIDLEARLRREWRALGRLARSQVTFCQLDLTDYVRFARIEPPVTLQ
jgi:hypothetical protein